METIGKIVFVSTMLSCNVHAQAPSPDYIPPSKYIASGQFNALFASVAATIDENSRNQSLGTFNTFLGRSDLNFALKGLPSGEACIANAAQAEPGRSWMLDHARDATVIMVNENHLTPASRTFVLAHLQDLKALGYTYIGFEALPDFIDGKDPERAITTGYYTIEPMFSALIREATDLGFKIFGYESAGTQLPQGTFEEQRNTREQLQLQNIISTINSAPANSKFIIFAGWSHIAEMPLPDFGPTGSFRWMASFFEEASGIDPLTIDLTQCFYASDDSEGWQGKIFIGEDGNSQIQGNYAGAVDAQIYLPAPATDTPDAANYYRRALGEAFSIPPELRSDVFPVLVQARLSGINAGAAAYDRVLLQPGEDFPLYLKRGAYQITSYRGDGSIAGEEIVDIE